MRGKGPKSPGFNTQIRHCVVFLGETLYFLMVLSTQDYIWILLSRKPDEMLGGNLQWTDIPFGEGGGDVKPKPKKSHRPTR